MSIFNLSGWTPGQAGWTFDGNSAYYTGAVVGDLVSPKLDISADRSGSLAATLIVDSHGVFTAKGNITVVAYMIEDRVVWSASAPTRNGTDLRIDWTNIPANAAYYRVTLVAYPSSEGGAVLGAKFDNVRIPATALDPAITPPSGATAAITRSLEEVAREQRIFLPKQSDKPLQGDGGMSLSWYRPLTQLAEKINQSVTPAQLDVVKAQIAGALGSPDGTIAQIPPKDIVINGGEGVDVSGPEGGPYSVTLRALDDSGSGTLRGIARDGYGRTTGTTDATITGSAGEIDVANGDAALGPPTLSLATVADAGGGTLQRTAFDTKGRKTGTSAATTDDLTEGTNLYHTDARARTAAVADAITDGITSVAPSQNAVFDALALRVSKAGDTMTGPLTTDNIVKIWLGGGGSNLNLAVGAQALPVNTTGTYNLAVGSQSLQANTTGYFNTAVGTTSLVSNVDGYSNSGVGAGALYSNTGGIGNLAVGHQACYYNTIGYYNVAIGADALQKNTQGFYNTAIGASALFDLNIPTQTAGYNIAIGYSAGRGVVTGVGNTIVGSSVTGLAAGLSNTLILATGAGVRRIEADDNGTTVTGPLCTPAAAPTIASAATIAPTKAITFISGVAAISTITPTARLSLGGGEITLIPTGAFTWSAAGNIALAGTAVVSRALTMTYDTTTAKWYPSYI